MRGAAWTGFLSVALACDVKETSGGGDTDATAGGGATPVEAMCEEIREASVACSTTTTDVSGTRPDCVDDFSQCTAAELAVLSDLAACVLNDCDDLSCYDELADLSGACLGIDTTSTSGTPTRSDDS